MRFSIESIQEDVIAFGTACRKAGLKVTPQRLEIYSELLVATDHPTAESLYQRLRMKMPMISLDTVYRTLATLASHGLINRVETVESIGRFEATRKRHHHLICGKCGEIMDFVWPLIDGADLPEEARKWGKVDHKNVVVYGVCSGCLE